MLVARDDDAVDRAVELGDQATAAVVDQGRLGGVALLQARRAPACPWRGRGTNPPSRRHGRRRGHGHDEQAQHEPAQPVPLGCAPAAPAARSRLCGGLMVASGYLDRRRPHARPSVRRLSVSEGAGRASGAGRAARPPRSSRKSKTRGSAAGAGRQPAVASGASRGSSPGRGQRQRAMPGQRRALITVAKQATIRAARRPP